MELGEGMSGVGTALLLFLLFSFQSLCHGMFNFFFKDERKAEAAP